jgi:hypothetical protein
MDNLKLKNHKSNRYKRSRSRSYNRKDPNKIKDNKRHRKNNNSFESSSSRSHDKFDNKLQKLRENTFNSKKERSFSPVKKKVNINLPNKGILANIIQDNIKVNLKLDCEEVTRANDKLKYLDSTGKKVNLN